MGTLNDWKKLFDGPFVGQPALFSGHAFTVAMPLRCCLIGRHGNWLVEEEALNQPVQGDWRMRRLEGMTQMGELFFWKNNVFPHAGNGTVVGRGADNRLYAHNGTAWQQLDQNAQFPAEAMRIDETLIGRGLNNHVWQAITVSGGDYRGALSWVDLGGDIRGRPSQVSSVMHLAVDSDGKIVYNVVTPGALGSPNYSGWMAMADSEFAENPVLVPLSPLGGSDRVMLVGHGTPEHQLWTREWVRGQGWGNWYNHNKRETVMDEIKGSPVVAQYSQDSAYCFIRGTDDSLWCLPYVNGEWQAWEHWGGELAADPAVAMLRYPGSIKLRVLAVGTDGGLWERSMIR